MSIYPKIASAAIGIAKKMQQPQVQKPQVDTQQIQSLQGMYKIRPYLQQQGIADNQIGFDKPNQTVTIGGQPFMQAKTNVGGTTYSDPTELQSNLQKFQQLNNKAPQDAMNSPMYQAIRAQGLTNANRAQNNTLAQLSSMTGGNPNSYSIAASQAAYNTEANKAPVDILPQLQEMYRNQFNQDQAYKEGVRQYDQNYKRGVFENDRGFNRGVVENDRGYKVTTAGLTGQFNGKPTYQAQQDTLNRNDANKLNSQKMSLEQQQMALQKQQNAIENSYKAGNLSLDQAQFAMQQLKMMQDNDPNNIDNKLKTQNYEMNKAAKDNTKLNDIISNIDKLYTYKDEMGKGDIKVSESLKPQLRNYVIGLNLPDEQTDQLLLRYGIPINK